MVTSSSATFNVLNYFNTTGQDYNATHPGACTFFTDRAGNPITVNSCTPTGPRGAARTEDFERQQAKIVTAINAMDVDIVSLEEIENSVALGEADRDDAVSALVAALNADAGSTRWAFAPSPAVLPDLAEQDVIRTAFIYNPATVDLVGPSKVLVGSAAFANAREPLAQAFVAEGGQDSDAFGVIVNHFKSKGSGIDDGTGQGNANPDRVAQANALVDFADAFKTERGITEVFLTGDFNAYSKEDPVQVLEAAGYTNLESDQAGEESYSFSGLSGSLDHVFANAAALPDVEGVDIWDINAGESIAYQYGRFNYNATQFFDATTPFGASDHNPELVGINVPDTPPSDVTLNLLGVNDFHGRINANTVKWAGTVEQLRAAGGEGNTLMIGAGDLIGASEFASAVADDQPTIDMFNALDLDASAVGNHEFDKGWADLRDRVIGAPGAENAEWDYLGANVYAEGTEDPVLPEYGTYRERRPDRRRDRCGHGGDQHPGQPRRHHRDRLRQPDRRGQPGRRRAERRGPGERRGRRHHRELPLGSAAGRGFDVRPGGGQGRRVRRDGQPRPGGGRDLQRAHPPDLRVGRADPGSARRDSADHPDR